MSAIRIHYREFTLTLIRAATPFSYRVYLGDYRPHGLGFYGLLDASGPDRLTAIIRGKRVIDMLIEMDERDLRKLRQATFRRKDAGAYHDTETDTDSGTARVADTNHK